MKITLGLNEEVNLPLEGYSFYFKNGDGPIDVTLIDQELGSDHIGSILPAQGPKGKNRFESFTVKNLHDEAQTIDIYLGERDFEDNRGAVDVNGVVSIVNAGGSTRVFDNVNPVVGTAVKLLDVDTDRLEASIYFNGSGRLGNSSVTATTGIPVSAGASWDDENTGELWFYPLSTGIVDIYESKK